METEEVFGTTIIIPMNCRSTIPIVSEISDSAGCLHRYPSVSVIMYVPFESSAFHISAHVPVYLYPPTSLSVLVSVYQPVCICGVTRKKATKVSLYPVSTRLSVCPLKSSPGRSSAAETRDTLKHGPIYANMTLIEPI